MSTKMTAWEMKCFRGVTSDCYLHRGTWRTGIWFIKIKETRVINKYLCFLNNYIFLHFFNTFLTRLDWSNEVKIGINQLEHKWFAYKKNMFSSILLFTAYNMDSFVYKPIHRVCVRQGPKQKKISEKEKSGKSASNEQN